MQRNIHNRLMFILVMCGELFLTSCASQSNHTLTIQNEADETVSILTHPHVEILKATLRDIISDRTNGTTAPQHFYFSHYASPEDNSTPTLYMLWLEQKLIWLFNPGEETLESWLGLRYPSSGQLINLTSGVVCTQNDVGTSSYSVTQSWAKDIIYKTYVIGDLIIIN